MRISVVIPTWNRRTLVQRAIDSVIAQTRVADEIIVVDDGSSDNTARAIRAHYPQVILIEQSSQGVSAARNAGIARATGDWIALLDSDDEWLPGKLAAQVGLLESAAGLRVCHTDEIWIRNGRRVNPMNKHAKPEGDIFPDCLPLCCVSPSSVMLHRQVFDQVGVFDETLPACEDYDLWLRVFSQFSAGLVRQGLVRKYGGHDDQLSRRHWGMDRFRVKALDKLLRSAELDPARRQATIDMLTFKCDILATGAAKRGKKESASAYRALAESWRS